MKKNKLNQWSFKDLPNFKTLKSVLLIALVSVFLTNPINSGAQSYEAFQSNGSFAEKIYLQLDTKVYTLGNIVWYKAIVANACDQVPSNLSRVLHVELITPEEIIFDTKLIKLVNGIGYGYFYLNKELNEGLYQVRAYTEWNKNFDSDFFYEDYIQVYKNDLKGNGEQPIRNVTLVKEGDNSNRIKATFSPVMIDTMHRKAFNVVVALDDKTDTLEVKSDRFGNYDLEYELDNDSQFATLYMQTENDKRYAKTIVLDQDLLDLQFFPESGEMVHGLQSKLGFKALDANGQGKLVEGDIVDAKDSVLTTFKSNTLGMGSFTINWPDSDQKYYARLKSVTNDGEILMYPLPEVAARGNQLVVERRGDNVLLAAQSNYINNDIVNVNVSFRGLNLYDMKITLNEGSSSILIPVEKLPEGIISFTMKDKNMQPVAERLYFNEKPDYRINLSVSTGKDAYAKREQTNLDIHATSSKGEPVNANLSVLVINKKQLGQFQNTRQNILSYFLLESELKGNIENPGYYFSSGNDRQNDLDALMLTQGWRKYNYSKKYEEITYLPERTLNISGEVSGVVSDKNKKIADLTLMTFGKTDQTVYTETSDSIGEFRFNLYDEYGDEMDAILQSTKKSGKKVDYRISFDRMKSPPVSFNHVKSVEKPDSVVNLLIAKNTERRKLDDAFPLDSGNIMIEEVLVEGYRLTPERKKLVEKYGMPTTILPGKVLKEKEEDWSWGLSSVLMYNYANIFKFSEDENDASKPSEAKVLGTDATVVAIDGEIIRVEDLAVGLQNYLPVSEIVAVEVVKEAKNFAMAYWEAHRTFPGPQVLSGSILSIYTRSGKGIYATKSRGLIHTTIPVFFEPQEFYAPKYAIMNPDEMKRPDLRALIHWAPVIETDSLGNASITFYNADNGGDMMVIVEAISEYGEIGYKQIEYNVEGKEEEYFIVN